RPAQPRDYVVDRAHDPDRRALRHRLRLDCGRALHHRRDDDADRERRHAASGGRLHGAERADGPRQFPRHFSDRHARRGVFSVIASFLAMTRRFLATASSLALAIAPALAQQQSGGAPPMVPGLSATPSNLASGAAAVNLGFTPLNPVNNLSDLTSPSAA